MVPNQIHTRNPTWIPSHSLNQEAQRLPWLAWGHTDNKPPLFQCPAVYCFWLLPWWTGALLPLPHTHSLNLPYVKHRSTKLARWLPQDSFMRAQSRSLSPAELPASHLPPGYEAQSSLPATLKRWFWLSVRDQREGHCWTLLFVFEGPYFVTWVILALIMWLRRPWTHSHSPAGCWGKPLL